MASSITSKVLYLVGFGGYDKLKIQTRDRPKPKHGEVLVNVKASGINFAELMGRMGLYDRTPKLPTVLGAEGSGDVIEVGEGVEKLKVGDRVMCVGAGGLWSEHAVVPAKQCFVMPESMSYEEAAAIPINYVTAYHMLFDMGNLRRGKSVLVHMVAGGVGTAATQLIKSVPDTVIFGTCSAEKHQVMKKMGVDHPIDYRTKDYAEEIRKIAPEGVDIVLDPLNGADAAKGYSLLKPLGKIIHFGAANLVTSERKSYWQLFKTYWSTRSLNPLFIISSNKGVFGYHMGHLEKNPELIVEAATELFSMYNKGLFKPQIDSVWALEDVGKAMARMHDRKNIGKVVLCPQMAAGESDVRNEVFK